MSDSLRINRAGKSSSFSDAICRICCWLPVTFNRQSKNCLVHPDRAILTRGLIVKISDIGESGHLVTFKEDTKCLKCQIRGKLHNYMYKQFMCQRRKHLLTVIIIKEAMFSS